MEASRADQVFHIALDQVNQVVDGHAQFLRRASVKFRKGFRMPVRFQRQPMERYGGKESRTFHFPQPYGKKPVSRRKFRAGMQCPRPAVQDNVQTGIFCQHFRQRAPCAAAVQGSGAVQTRGQFQMPFQRFLLERQPRDAAPTFVQPRFPNARIGGFFAEGIPAWAFPLSIQPGSGTRDECRKRA